jgi:hypothetical protein
LTIPQKSNKEKPRRLQGSDENEMTKTPGPLTMRTLNKYEKKRHMLEDERKKEFYQFMEEVNDNDTT